MNAAEPKLAVRTQRPPSPCTNVCALDGQGRCVGCLRTGAEIGHWMAMSADEQWQLVDEIERRRNLEGR